MKYCEKCELHFEDDLEKCPTCGEVLETEEDSTIPFTIVAFLIPVVGLIMFLASFKSHPKRAKFIVLGAAYDAFITELSVPGATGLNTRNINVRKIKFLEPKSSFNPALAYDDPANTPNLWRDPWGNPYKIYINIDGKDAIAIGSKTIAAKAAGYSVGPNGTDDQGCHVDQNNPGNCPASNKHKLHDDITTWNN